MSVIAEFRIPATDFELGRILTVDGRTTIELERLVPIGGSAIPLFWVHEATPNTFVESLRSNPNVDAASVVDVFEDRTLFMLEWDSSRDDLVRSIQRSDGHLLSATGTAAAWEFELRFPDHDALSEFTTFCADEGVALTINRVYNPTSKDAGPFYGLTEPQFEAMTLAVRKGYYDIPRGCSTKELAGTLDISDQAVTERLRRAIVTLVTNTLLAVEADT